jgi:8-oxo-dGTP pyrophosphatase MutT (NUDIX family)
MASGPEPGTIINTGEPTVPRQAATVVVLRGGVERLEVLLVQRTPKARFMGGAWVFPGGAVDAHEGDGDAAHRAAAVREVQEETGIALPDPAALVAFARWITPPEITMRFDTYFFLAEAPAGSEVQIDGEEIVDARWFEPRRASC